MASEDIKEIVINDNLILFVANTQEKIEKIRNSFNSALTIRDKIIEFCKNKKYQDELFTFNGEILIIKNIKDIEVFVEEYNHFYVNNTINMALGYHYLSINEPKKAFKYCNNMSMTDDVSIYYACKCCSDVKDYAGVVGIITRKYDIDKLNEIPERTLFLLIECYSNDKKYVEAISVITKKYNIDELNEIPEKIIFFLAECYLYVSYFTAEKYFLYLEEKKYRDFDVLNMLIRIYKSNNNRMKILEYEGKLCIIKKCAIEASEIADIYMESKNYAEAVKFFLYAEEFSKGEHKHTINLIKCYYHLNDKEKVMELAILLK